jgi:molybdate transport system substrate-binding protein
MAETGPVKKRLHYFLMVALTWVGGFHLHAATVTVFAAASLRDSLRELATTYERRGGDRITFNFGGSSLLARQIQEGAPADLFFSADEAKVAALERQDLLVKGTRINRLSNSLVVITSADNPINLVSAKDLAGPSVKRITLGDPQAVPIGMYAREYLEKLQLWSSIAPKVVPTDNVRAALAAVEAGNADASIVYKTDAAISKKIRIAFEVPRDEGPRIVYPLALVKDSKQPEAARRLLAFLATTEADRVFLKYGFIVLEPERKNDR